MNERYFARYPDDRARVREIHRRLDGEPFLLAIGRAADRAAGSGSSACGSATAPAGSSSTT